MRLEINSYLSHFSRNLVGTYCQFTRGLFKNFQNETNRWHEKCNNPPPPSCSQSISDILRTAFPFVKKLQTKLQKHKSWSKHSSMEKLLVKCRQNWDLGSISPMFCEQLLHAQIPKAQKNTVISIFLRFWDLWA